MSDLKKLFDKYECDKSSKHGYHEVYEQYFEPVREEPIRILEIGVWKGASTAAFAEYMPNAEIVGVDIFTRNKLEDTLVYENENVTLVKGDSTLSTRGVTGKFDFIIDDGKHTPEANTRTFQNFFSLLKPTGVYFIEDVWPLHKMTTKEWEHPWVKNAPDKYNMIIYNMFMGAVERYNVKHHDRRKTNEPDSYIMAVTQ